MPTERIYFAAGLKDRLIQVIRDRFPKKTYGYLVSNVDDRTATDFLLFDGNLRNDPVWQPKFHAYGKYFVHHDDAGFVATPAESLRVQKEIWSRKVFEVAVFHSHQRHPANFSEIDYDMHIQRVDSLWHVVISMRNPRQPQLRAFGTTNERVRELEVKVLGAAATEQPVEGPVLRDPGLENAALRSARETLELDHAGRPKCRDAEKVLAAVDAVLQSGDRDMVDEVLVRGFLRDSSRRYAELVAPHIRTVGAARLILGTHPAASRHFCGESPEHEAWLSSFRISDVPVTNELYGALDAGRLNVAKRDRANPVVNVTWNDASLFALWMGCRLPTEAEWERACGAGSNSEWCCSEHDLIKHAWYGDNVHGELHNVGLLEPNALGLFDMHGSVWEWCLDDYDQDYYARASEKDPLHLSVSGSRIRAYQADKVCRGGSIYALPEMCRTRYRFHEPANVWARDLGFRLVADPSFLSNRP